MLPAAPGRFSMTMLCPSRAPSGWAMIRAAVSTPPPGGHGTMTRIDWDGYGWPSASPAHANSTAPSHLAPIMSGVPPLRARSLLQEAGGAIQLRRHVGEGPNTGRRASRPLFTPGVGIHSRPPLTHHNNTLPMSVPASGHEGTPQRVLSTIDAIAI